MKERGEKEIGSKHDTINMKRELWVHGFLENYFLF